MKSVDLHHCQAGSVVSRGDGGVKLTFVTPELRPSEAGALIELHGKNVRLAIFPEDIDPEETVVVTTEREQKSPSKRFHDILFVAHKQGIDRREGETFAAYYLRHMDRLCEAWKAKLT